MGHVADTWQKVSGEDSRRLDRLADGENAVIPPPDEADGKGRRGEIGHGQHPLPVAFHKGLDHPGERPAKARIAPLLGHKSGKRLGHLSVRCKEGRKHGGDLLGVRHPGVTAQESDVHLRPETAWCKKDKPVHQVRPEKPDNACHGATHRMPDQDGARQAKRIERGNERFGAGPGVRGRMPINRITMARKVHRDGLAQPRQSPCDPVPGEAIRAETVDEDDGRRPRAAGLVRKQSGCVSQCGPPEPGRAAPDGPGTLFPALLPRVGSAHDCHGVIRPAPASPRARMVNAASTLPGDISETMGGGIMQHKPVLSVVLTIAALVSLTVEAFGGTMEITDPRTGERTAYRPSFAPRDAPSRPQYRFFDTSTKRWVTYQASNAEMHARRRMKFARAEVSFISSEPPGTVVVDTRARHLYYVRDGETAIRYGIGVGRRGFTWSGVEPVSRKAKWPDWTPPAEMREREPWLPKWMPGGPENPLGARALYLGDTLYRIHGTTEADSIGAAVSSGCIRMLNEDVADLFERVEVGADVIVLGPDADRSGLLAALNPF